MTPEPSGDLIDGYTLTYRVVSAKPSNQAAKGTDPNQDTWLADTISPGNVYLTSSGGVFGVAEMMNYVLGDNSVPEYATQLDGLYRNERNGSFAYTLDTTGVTSLVFRAYLCELFHQTPGSRIFSIRLNGVSPTTMTNIDMVAIAGDRYRPLMREVELTGYNSANLVVNAVATQDGPSLCAFEVWTIS